MERGLRIPVVDPDEDYLGIEVCAASSRFAGATRIYAGFDELSALASQIEGFPTTSQDERRFEFGSTDPGVAGGFASLRFHCVDGAGHTELEVVLTDDDRLYASASAKFAFPIAAAGVDQFTRRLRDVERNRSGEAELPAAV
jgi:hypothetical protein